MSAFVPNQTVYSLTNNHDHTRDQSFTYDALNRLISAQNAGTDCTQTVWNGKKFWGNSYGYDAWGNLLQKTVTKCSAETLSVTALVSNQLLEYSYDAAGNMIVNPTNANSSLTYDAENRLSTCWAPYRNGLAASYTLSYDGYGNRVEKFIRPQRGGRVAHP